MTAAERNKMLNDMKNAITLETDIAAQHQLMECCGKTMQEKCPVFVPLEKPVQRAQSVFVDSPNEMHLILAWIMALLFGGTGLFCLLFDSDAISVAFRVVMFLILLGAAVGIWFAFASTYLEQKKAFSAYIEQLEKDQAKMKEWKAANQKKEEAHKRQYRDWEASKQAILQSIQAQTQKSIALRDAFYAQENFLYAKYLTLPALTSIYEYFLTGRCDELTGPHGAYNLYEDEVRKDTVIEKLNVVIENLEQIKQSQYLLYQQVKAIQQTTNAIAQELVQIKGYTIALTQLSALNAYYARLNERNTRISMYYHLAS